MWPNTNCWIDKLSREYWYWIKVSEKHEWINLCYYSSMFSDIFSRLALLHFLFEFMIWSLVSLWINWIFFFCLAQKRTEASIISIRHIITNEHSSVHFSHYLSTVVFFSLFVNRSIFLFKFNLNKILESKFLCHSYIFLSWSDSCVYYQTAHTVDWLAEKRAMKKIHTFAHLYSMKCVGVTFIEVISL